MKDPHPPDSALDEVVASEQLRAHYSQLPAIAIAPAVGALYSAWVLWDAVDDRFLVLGVMAVFLMSTVRLVMYWRFFRQTPVQMAARRWRFAAVAAALVSGCVWGSAAPLLYPPNSPDYVVFLVVLLALLPVVPVAALAAYMPAFTAYFSCCMLPFIATLASHDSRAERLAAVLLVLMMGAIYAFARRYSRSLREATRLRVHLAHQSASLEDALAHKSHFIAAASHDLRQPVHAMGLLVESLRERALRQAQAGTASDAPTDGILEQMEASMHNLRGMLSNMLDLSRLDADVVQPRLAVVPLAGLIERVTEDYADSARAIGLRLRRRGGAVWVRTDPALVERILRNLLANALRCTAHGGVLVAARTRGTNVELLVIDSGAGIKAQDQQRVFDEFVRIDTPHSPDAPGMGLGLAIVRRLAALLGHRVWLRSRVGRGSTFGIELPLVLPSPAALAPQAAEAAATEAAATEAAATEAAWLAQPMPPGLVMLLDDDEAIGFGTATLLQSWGHRALVYAGADQARRDLLARQLKPDLLIADFRLASGASGLEAVADLRAALGYPIPVILVTGDTAPDRIRQAYQAGYLLLHKPVDPALLRTCMAQVWTEARAGAPAPAGSAIS